MRKRSGRQILHGKRAKGKKRRKKRYLLKLILFLMLCAGAYFALRIDYFEIDGIAVGGNSEISDEEIIELSKIRIGGHIFDFDTWMAGRRIRKNMYIEDVEINRLLPDKIEIIVKERKGKAQFINNEKYVITGNDGTVLEISENLKEVTLVRGVTITKAKVKDKIGIKEEKNYEKSMEILKAMEEGDLFFRWIKVSGDQVRINIYKRLACKGKYKNVIKAIENETLKTAIYDRYQKGIEKGTLTLGDNGYCSFSP